jgi:hypothetical protein
MTGHIYFQPFQNKKNFKIKIGNWKKVEQKKVKEAKDVSFEFNLLL